MRYVAAASPEFMALHFADGVTPESIARAPMLSYDRKDAMQDKWLHAQGLASRHGPPKHWLPSAYAFVRACEAGVGWAMQPTVLIQRYLDAGTLVEVLPDTGVDIPLYWAHARNAQAGLQRLTHCVITAAAGWLQPLPADGPQAEATAPKSS